jgi:transposase
MAERYAGIDWASEAHDVLVADEDGEELLAGTFAHDEKGLSGLCRALTRAREDLLATRTAVMNQLRSELERFWPGPLRLFSHMDAEILLAFLERYPSPADAHGLGVARMQAFLVRERYSGEQHPTALMAKLRSAPRGRIGELELAARRRLVLSYVAMIGTLNAQIKDLERAIRGQVRAHPDGAIFLSLFKSPNSVITAAELLAEIGDCRERYPTRDALAADAGQAAVAIESGKWKTAGFRRACNKRLRVAFCRLADSSRHWHPWAQTLYAQARQRGHEHPRAIRTVGRAWCRVVWQCWRNHTTYDPTKHRALQRHITVTIPSPAGPGARPGSHRADGRHGCHPKGGPHEPSAKRLTGRRHPLPQAGG